MLIVTRTRALSPVMILALFVAACGSSGRGPVGPPATGDDAITIASFDFPESALLAEIYAQALESGGFKAKRAFSLGPRELVEPALERGLVEFVPEYLGTSLQFLTRGAAESSADQEATRRKLEEAFRVRGITLLASAPAQDANAIAVSAETAAKHRLETISDLVPIGGELVFGGPPECPDRPLCLPGLATTYGLRFKRFVALDVGGPLTAAALAAGEIDVALLFTTDGNIRARHFVVLTDDRGLQPAENVTPVVRAEVVETFGSRFVDVVDRVSAHLTTEALAGLNHKVSLGGTMEDVATEWLRLNGLIRSPG